MSSSYARMGNVELQALAENALRWRGPAAVDPDLPADPGQSPYSDGFREWANDVLAATTDEIKRRQVENDRVDEAFWDQMFGARVGPVEGPS